MEVEEERPAALVWHEEKLPLTTVRQSVSGTVSLPGQGFSYQQPCVCGTQIFFRICLSWLHMGFSRLSTFILASLCFRLHDNFAGAAAEVGSGTSWSSCDAALYLEEFPVPMDELVPAGSPTATTVAVQSGEFWGQRGQISPRC